jgi:hypothetical protein
MTSELTIVGFRALLPNPSIEISGPYDMARRHCGMQLQ